MSELFRGATSFNSDISRWDVSRVTNMGGMFRDATLFNGDMSKWNVSRVINMTEMFWGATSFNQALCGAAWVLSKAKKEHIFQGSSGSYCPG